MLGPNSRVPSAIALVGTLLGLVFATYSTLDYAQHLDRRLHDVHCSFVPGAPVTAEAEACRAAMYSPYAAIMREEMWGGIPISLFALGAFTFFAGFAAYLLVAGGKAPRLAVTFFAIVSVTPLLVSLAMFSISLIELGSLCKTCVGIYIASFLLALGGLMGLATLRAPAPEPPRRPSISPAFAVVWLAVLGLITLVPAVVYANTVPDHSEFVTQCGELQKAPKKEDRLIHVRFSESTQSALFFEDPLCPTCKGFHQRLKQEDILPKLDIELVLFPLDSECNWMLDRPLHPGACVVSKAVICGEDQAFDVLEWAYDNQDELTRAGKAGEEQLRQVIEQRWGGQMVECIDSREAKVQLNKQLHFAADNAVPVSTPQVYLGKRRVCDEDTDMGLPFTLAQLAPEVLQ